MSAILMSEMMRSNSEVFSCMSASSALAALTTMKPSFFRKISSSSRSERSSSTIRILARFCILQIDNKSRSDSLSRPHGYAAIVGRNDLIHDRKTQTGPVPERRIEWNKQSLHFLLPNPDAGIAKLNRGISISGLERNGQCPTIGHCFEGVGREIVKHLAHHAFVDVRFHRPEPGLNPVFLPELRAVSHEFHGFRNQFRQVRLFAIRRQWPRVTQKTCDGPIQALRLSRDD